MSRHYANLQVHLTMEHLSMLKCYQVDKPEVTDWLSNMTFDKKGLIHLFSWSGLIDANILLQDLFQVGRPIPANYTLPLYIPLPRHHTQIHTKRRIF